MDKLSALDEVLADGKPEDNSQEPTRIEIAQQYVQEIVKIAKLVGDECPEDFDTVFPRAADAFFWALD